MVSQQLALLRVPLVPRNAGPGGDGDISGGRCPRAAHPTWALPGPSFST